MKKNLLFTMVLLAMAGIVKAQDVYLLGTKNYYYEWSTVYMPTVWKNGEILYQDGEPLEGYSFESGGLAIDDETHDVYWYSARSFNNEFERACIYKNDQVVSNINVVGNIAPRIRDMQLKKFASTHTMALFSAGYKHSEGHWNAVIWREGNELFVPTAGSSTPSYAFDIEVVGDDENSCEYYYCGEKDINYDSHATVWHNDEQIFFNETHSNTNNIIVDDGDIYVFGSEFDDVTWITTSYVWKNGEVFMTFEEPDASVKPQFMAMSEGDLWICTTTQHESDEKSGDGKVKIWKNGEVMYEHTQSEIEDSYVLGMDVLDGDVYYIIQAWNDPTCDVYKNGELLYGFDGDNINIIALKVCPEISYEYTITTEVTPENAGTVSGGGTYPEGTEVELEAFANEGYMFTRWSDGVTENPRTITVTCDATYTAVFDNIEGINESYKNTLSVYPNPANDMIRIKNGSDDAVEIYNATGQLMMSVETNNGNISVSGLPAGLYLLKQGASMTQFVKK